jgi:hypothetical protein
LKPITAATFKAAGDTPQYFISEQQGISSSLSFDASRTPAPSSQASNHGIAARASARASAAEPYFSRE